MTNSLSEFTLELEDEINKRTYLTSKWDMLGVRNQGEKFKTIIAILIGDIINKWYNTEFTEDNFCEEEDILIALETFNAICKSNVWYDVNVVNHEEPTYSPIHATHYWDDDLYWDDFTLWED
jgi:hypothetical protein